MPKRSRKVRPRLILGLGAVLFLVLVFAIGLHCYRDWQSVPPGVGVRLERVGFDETDFRLHPKTERFPSVEYVLTNESSKTFLLQHDGAVRCEYRDRTDSGWTNWTPQPSPFRRGRIESTPNSAVQVIIRRREDGGERQAGIILFTQSAKPRLSGIPGRVEKYVSGLFRKPYYQLWVTLPTTNAVQPDSKTLNPTSNEAARH